MPRKLLALLTVAAALLAAWAAPSVAEAPFTRDPRDDRFVTVGGDGAVWSVPDFGQPLVAHRVAVDGSTTAVELADVGSGRAIAPGLGGDAVWVADGDRIHRVAADSAVRTMPLPPDTFPTAMLPSADGDVMLFLGNRGVEAGVIGTVDGAGAVATRPAPFAVDSGASLVDGPGGTVWASVSGAGGSGFARIDADLRATPVAVGGRPAGAATGPDGLLWVVVATGESSSAIVKLRADGTAVALQPLPGLGGAPVLGPDAAVYVPTAYGYWRVTAGGDVRLVGDSGRVGAGSGADDPPAAPGESVLRGTTLWYGTGHLTLDGRPVPVVELTASPVRADGRVELTARVRSDRGAAFGTVAFVARRCCYRGYDDLQQVAAAEIGPDGVARATASVDRFTTTIHADYSGDGANLGTTSPEVPLDHSPSPPPGAPGWEPYVRGTYRALLGREGEPEGVAFWVGVLDRTRSPGEFTTALTSTVEWRRVAVDAAFGTLLGRSADPAGRDFFVDVVLGRGRRVAEVVATVASAPEYLARNGGGDPGAWVDSLYRGLLHREPDASGRSYLLGLLASGRSHIAVAGSVAASPEAFGVTVDQTYADLLGRGPDAAGRAYWVGRMVGGDVEAELVAAIAASDEFRVRVGG